MKNAKNIFTGFALLTMAGCLSSNQLEGQTQQVVDVVHGAYERALAIVFPSGSSNIVAQYTARRSSCIAPCTVFFSATGTSYNGHPISDKYLDLDYQWDFGDPDSGFWQKGAQFRAGNPQSRNKAFGFVAAHTYEPSSYPDSCNGQSQNCRRFDISLTVCDRDGCDTPNNSLTIEILDPNHPVSGFGSANTVCIRRTTGSSTAGCPTSNIVTGTNASQILSQQGCLNSRKRCLFRSGETFSLTDSMDFSGTSERTIGTYGPNCPGPNCSRATLQMASDMDGVGLGNGSANVRMVDIHLNGFGSRSTSNGIYGGSGITSRFLALRMDLEHFDNGFRFICSYNTSTCNPGVAINNELAFIDGSIHHASTMGGNDFYVAAEPYALMGSKVGDKVDPNDTAGAPNDPNTVPSSQGGPGGLGEHNLRSKFAGPGSVVQHSEFGLLDNSTNPANRSGHNYVGCWPRDISRNNAYPDESGWEGFGAVQGNTTWKFIAGLANQLPLGQKNRAYSREYIVSDNFVSMCRYQNWSASWDGTDGGVTKTDEHHRYVLIEGNHFSAQYNDLLDGSPRMLRIGNASHVRVRNNTFDSRGHRGALRAITVFANPAQYNNADSSRDYQEVTDIRISNNTYFDRSVPGTDDRTFFDLQDSRVSGIQLDNNLAYYEGGSLSLFGGVSVPSTSGSGCCGGGACPGSCNQNASGNPFISSVPGGQTHPGLFQIGSSSSVRGDGITLGRNVRRDNTRGCIPFSDGSRDLGAHEFGSEACTATPGEIPPGNDQLGPPGLPLILSAN